ncbi:MAG: hypothetical protein ACRYFK_17555 [Janthinobacterium lividum]
MRKLLLILFVSLLANRPWVATAQQMAKPAYIQIFYEGSSWLAGREVLNYSPVFRGKTGELVREDSTRAVSPGVLVFDGPIEATTQVYDSPVATEKRSFVRGTDGKMRPQTNADVRKERAEANARMTRGLNLVATRATLARTALTNALNEAAADGWEVSQMTAWGGQGGLVYLLRRR